MPSLKAFTTEGKAFTLKATPILRKYGRRCRSFESQDNKVWPGEVGAIKIEDVKGLDWLQKVATLEFSRGRRVSVAVMIDKEFNPTTDGTWAFEYQFTGEEFKAAKVAASAKE